MKQSIISKTSNISSFMKNADNHFPETFVHENLFTSKYFMKVYTLTLCIIQEQNQSRQFHHISRTLEFNFSVHCSPTPLHIESKSHKPIKYIQERLLLALHKFQLENAIIMLSLCYLIKKYLTILTMSLSIAQWIIKLKLVFF